MIQKIASKILSWWLCLITRFTKLSIELQYSIYTIIFILPMFLGYTLGWTFNAFMFVYYLAAYLFFQIGFIMVKK